MTNIEKHSGICTDSLSKEFYLKSLLQEAREKEKLSEYGLETVQMQALRLLAAAIERYTRGKSSSVPVEAAQEIMKSIFYTTGLYLKSLPDAECALAAVKAKPLETLCLQGRAAIRVKLNTAKHLYRLVRETRLQTENESYNATVDEGIQSFFALYNPDFEAHETPASIDYQLANPVWDVAGVEFMAQYLENLYLENQFCSYFDSRILHQIMQGYDPDYRNLLINLFAQALQNALGCMLLQKDVFSLNIDPEDIDKLKQLLGRLSKPQIYETLRREAEKLIQLLCMQDDLAGYIHASLPEISARLHIAVELDVLEPFFPSRCVAATKRELMDDPKAEYAFLLQLEEYLLSMPRRKEKDAECRI